MKANHNPFRSSSIAKLRYQIDAVNLGGLVDSLEAHEWRGCLIGPEGSGKTTLLEDLEPSIRERGLEAIWIRLNRENSRADLNDALLALGALRRGQCCLLDGGEVLGYWRWRRAIRVVRQNGGGLIATVHRRCPLPVVYRTDVRVDQAVVFARELAGTHWNQEVRAVAEHAFAASQGNAREVFRACYLHCVGL
jgi:hypothetical protein